MQVLIAEDDRSSAIVLAGVLGAMGYDVLVASDGQSAWELLRDNDCRIVISDWQMPRMDGLELCRNVRARDVGSYVYFILLTSRSGSHNLVEGLQAGADDFITKPFDAEELRVRMKSAERVVSLESRDLIIFTLAKLAESRDPETGAHLERVREYVRILARRLQKNEAFSQIIDQDFIQMMYLSSPLHDIGKVGIPDNVLLKPGRLTDEEMDCMRQHTVIGGETLDAALAAHPSASFLRVASEIAWTHHERYDGRGYPKGLAGENIPLPGRIMALADVYDALTTKRVYKDAMSHETAREILVEGRGTQFDPDVVDAFVAGESDFLRIKQALQDSEESETPAPPALAPAAG